MILTFIIVVLFLSNITFVYAQDSADSWTNNYVFNRGIFGCVYKVVMLPLKAIEYVIFGRYGVCAIDDYFKINRVCAEQKPKY